MKKKRKLLSTSNILNILGIILGSMLMGLGYAVFLMPFKIAPGGVGGLAQIIYFKLGVTPGIFMLMVNIPLFFVGVWQFGKQFGFKTIIAILLTSFFSDFFISQTFLGISALQPFMYVINGTRSFTNEYILAVLAGALTYGLGIGLVIRNNGSTGGSDIPALLLRKYFGFSMGAGYMVIDTVIILLTGYFFKDANLILWALFALVVTSKVTDVVIEGFSVTKGVTILSDKTEEIREEILFEMKRGCTIYKGEGGFSRQPRDIIYVIITNRELARLKQKVKDIDSQAFFVVNDIHQTLGKGFRNFE
ncbi:MAG: YitT family protein [Candidatus Zophobacter franzmannii]|nr:YitT family protein [Candidatus Zophobacter franzmannii]